MPHQMLKSKHFRRAHADAAINVSRNISLRKMTGDFEDFEKLRECRASTSAGAITLKLYFPLSISWGRSLEVNHQVSRLDLASSRNSADSNFSHGPFSTQLVFCMQTTKDAIPLGPKKCACRMARLMTLGLNWGSDLVCLQRRNRAARDRSISPLA